MSKLVWLRGGAQCLELMREGGSGMGTLAGLHQDHKPVKQPKRWTYVTKSRLIKDITFYVLVKAIYTLGYSLSLTSLVTGSMILCLFRKLRCTRNYIHLNLFLSFILRAVAVLVKDSILYSGSGTLPCPDQLSSWGRAEEDRGWLCAGSLVPPQERALTWEGCSHSPCPGSSPMGSECVDSAQCRQAGLCSHTGPRQTMAAGPCPSLPPCVGFQVGCKLSLVLFQYCVTANFCWLLVEGLYLHTLLVAVVSPGCCFRVYLLIGWGVPTMSTGAWATTRLLLEDTGAVGVGVPELPAGTLSPKLRKESAIRFRPRPSCWDMNEHSVPWWIIRVPILISIIVNFILFVSIVRILLQKLTSPDVGGNDQPQYRRLAKSTLLLIPLFGVHYVVFAVFPTHTSSEYQLLFELCAGSFQGLVVVVLYCFLNSEVCEEAQRAVTQEDMKAVGLDGRRSPHGPWMAISQAIIGLCCRGNQYAGARQPGSAFSQGSLGCERRDFSLTPEQGPLLPTQGPGTAAQRSATASRACTRGKPGDGGPG
ncbi:Vasoactive intestinal polypeptide receptor 2 [Tupaia chinensis]|uniref:Vasoactive intestinal polypeptide receptor 2 n=1 Tax=Tupaia chinensis TaxID=246437 RepID=L9L4Z6_TUPCH|nr:Vasoactive intestinal polypeptide receptor 2 [Tupaia chinensis]